MEELLKTQATGREILAVQRMVARKLADASQEFFSFEITKKLFNMDAFVELFLCTIQHPTMIYKQSLYYC